MARNWGLPTKDERTAFHDAKEKKPLLTLFVSAVFGVIGAAVAVMSFAAARAVLADLFHGGSLILAVAAAGFGCWAYIWLARPRFAAHFSGQGDPFSSLIRFYARAAIVLVVLLIAGQSIGLFAPIMISVLLLCVSGGAGAAAAFQTVLAFVPRYEDSA
jgi:hypothetical protein